MKKWHEQAMELYKQGMTYRKIAETLAMPEGTINSYLARNRTTEPADAVAELNPIQQQQAVELEQYEKRLGKEELRRAAHIGLIVDHLTEAKNTIPPEPIRKLQLPKTGKSNNTIPILMLSDIQCGTKISRSATGGLNEYNKDTLKIQMEKLVDGIVSISTKQLSEYPLLKIHMLGDMLEGFNIFPGQAYHMDMDVYQQFFYLKELLVKFLMEMLQLFDKIEILCVPGNHGRIGNKGESPHYLNWDNFFYKHMESVMQNHKQITWEITDAWYLLDRTFDTNSLLIHGDGIKSWNGIPFYGIQRADARYTKLMASQATYYDMIEVGHFHCPAEIPTPTGPIIINGCFPGASMYALKDLNTANRPLQKFFGVHNRHGKTWDFSVYLD